MQHLDYLSNDGTATRMNQRRNTSPFECVALLLQGGGALGAYQGGVYQALAEADLHPDWVAGISIGAINAAIVAGNPPEKRVARLREFWEEITSMPGWDWLSNSLLHVVETDGIRDTLNQISAGFALAAGAANMFVPRFVSPWLQPSGSLAATSYYDTAPLKATLERLVDFDRLNNGEMRLSTGAVNVRTGNFEYFDTLSKRLGPEHIMASGALPPGFPAIEIAGEYYWDGGLVSNTPVQWALEQGLRQDMLAFEVDLWSARGPFPRSMAEVTVRQKEILYSSRTRDNTDQFKKLQCVRHRIAKVLIILPEEAMSSEDVQHLARLADEKVYNLVHLIYRSKNYEGQSKDYEFSRRSMDDHWQAGYRDTKLTLGHPEIFERPQDHDGVQVFDFGA